MLCLFLIAKVLKIVNHPVPFDRLGCTLKGQEEDRSHLFMRPLCFHSSSPDSSSLYLLKL